MHNYDDFSERMDPNFANTKNEAQPINRQKKSSGSSYNDYPRNKELKNLDSYSDNLLESQTRINYNPDMDSLRSGESIIKNYIFDNTKYNPNTSKCISFWKTLKQRPDIKPCPCDFKIKNASLYTFANENPESLESFGPNVTWYEVLEELQRRKMDRVAFSATFQSCRLCERDEPYAKFKRKMGQNYSDTELRDYEDITCLNCWTSYSKGAEDAKNQADQMTKLIFMSTCACEDSKKCTCSVNETTDKDIREVAYISQNFKSSGSESGEGDSMSVTGQKSAGKLTSHQKEQDRASLHFHNFRKLLNLENPSDEPSSIIMEEGEVQQEVEICDCQICEVSVCDKEIEDDPEEDQLSFASFITMPSKSPAEMMHPQYKPGCCYNCGILGCVCNICAPVIPKPKKNTEKPKAPKKTKKVKIENFDKFLNQCEHCGLECKCWKNKVDHAKNYLENLKEILDENVTYDKACGTEDSEEDNASTTSAKNLCIICGHRGCNCKTSRGRPSMYFQTIKFGSSLPKITTFAKVALEKTRKEESRSRDLGEVRRQPSDSRVNLEKLKAMRLKHQHEKPIIKDCKNKYMVTPAQKASSIIKNNKNLVIKKDLFGVPHVTRYPDKQPIVEPTKDAESYGSLSESSDDSDDTEVVHNLEPWYCTARPKEEEREMTYGRIL